MKRTFILVPMLLLIVSGCASPSGIARKDSFKKPSIKDEFCGAYINYQFCKCAFHGEFCKEIGKSRKEADNYVNDEYNKWLAPKREAFATNCKNGNGYMDGDTCNYCEQGYAAAAKGCVKGDTAADKVALPDGPYNDDCSLKQDEYDRDWKKYSDIDKAIPYEDRSYEAKQALVTYETMIAKMVEAFALERDIDLEKGMQEELATYRAALVQNIKTNLLKSFWRLAWVTYSTIDSTKGVKSSYEKLLDFESISDGISASLKIIRTGVPSDSKLAIDTSTIAGKVKSAGASVALDAVESLGDPATIATTIFQEAGNATLPSTADITPEEVAILEQQHLKKGVIDDILKESKAVNAQREAQLATFEKEIEELRSQIGPWEQKEKERVANALVDSCEKLTNRASQ